MRKLKEIPKPLRPFIKKIDIKNRKITIRLTEYEYQLIKTKAKLLNMTERELLLKGVERL